MIAVMGATGKIGSTTIRELRQRGADVRAIVRDESKADQLRELGCEIAVADAHDSAAIQAAITGAEAVQIIVPLDLKAIDAPADSTAIIDAIYAALAQVLPDRVVAISDYGAHLDIDTGVTNTFHYLEERLGQLPGKVTFVRSAEHMQNLSRVAKRAVESGTLPTFHSPLNKIFPTVSAYDVGGVSAELLLATDTPRIVHVEGPRRYRALDIASMLSDISGRNVTAVELPRSEWDGVLIQAGISPSYAALVTRLNDVHNTGVIDVEESVGEIRLGATDLHEVLASLVQ
ncbi:MAG: NmrA family NAD(P)-binding protein [Thermomicrobiales bacterium]